MNQLAIQDAVSTKQQCGQGLRELFDSRRPAPSAFAALIQQISSAEPEIKKNFAMLMQQMDAVQKAG